MVNVLGWELEVSEFEIHFRYLDLLLKGNTLEKGMN